MHHISWANRQTLQNATWDVVQHRVSPPVQAAIEKVLSSLDGGFLTREECLLLANCTGDDLFGLVVAANEIRQRLVGDVVSYVVTRNINFTNVCFVGCKFCAFGVSSRDHTAYFLSLDEVAQKAREAEQWGATEVCIQGGLPRNLPPFYYRDILRAVKSATPKMHCHAFSPMEMVYGVELTGMPIREYLLMLKENGLDTLPGTAAEILDDSVRHVLSRNKLSTAQWREVIETAHQCGIRSTSTMMYGHTETPEHWVNQLLLLREIQSRTGGFTEFVPLGLHSRQHVAVRAGTGARRRNPGGTLEGTRVVSRCAGGFHQSHSGLVGEARPRSFAVVAAGRRRRLRRHALRGEHLAAGGSDRGAVHLDRGIPGAHSRTGTHSCPAQHGVHKVHLSDATERSGHVGGGRRGMIAIVGGTGPEGSGLALRWARAGESVIIGSRDAERARAAAAKIAETVGPLGSVEGAENATAVKMCDTVVLTVPFAGQAELLKQLKPSFRQGTVLIDATVPLAAAVGGRPTRVLGVWQGSAAEQAAEIVGKNVAVAGSFSQPLSNRSARRSAGGLRRHRVQRRRARAAGRVRAGDQDSRRARHRWRQAGERAHRGSHDRAAHHAQHPA